MIYIIFVAFFEAALQQGWRCGTQREAPWQRCCCLRALQSLQFPSRKSQRQKTVVSCGSPLTAAATNLWLSTEQVSNLVCTDHRQNLTRWRVHVCETAQPRAFHQAHTEHESFNGHASCPWLIAGVAGKLVTPRVCMHATLTSIDHANTQCEHHQDLARQ
jgi:hypothetical protein